MRSGDITQTGPREALIRGVADALGPAHEKMANAILHLAESAETQRTMNDQARDVNHKLWTEVRDDIRTVQSELRTGFDRIVKAVENLPQTAAAPVPPSPLPEGSVVIRKEWILWFFIAIFGGNAAPDLLSRVLQSPPQQTVYVTPDNKTAPTPAVPDGRTPSVPFGPPGPGRTP